MFMNCVPNTLQRPSHLRPKGRNEQETEFKQWVTTPATGMLMVCGPTGTGKTYCIRGWIEGYLSIYLNLMQLEDPSVLFEQLLIRLNQNTSRNSLFAFQQLKSMAISLTSPLVIVLDEVDILLAGYQDIVYSLLELQKKSKHLNMKLIGITSQSHSLDLEPRVWSRIGLASITFPPYKQSELQILLEEWRFTKKALAFCSRTVASRSGDIRLGLHYAQSGEEIRRQRKKQKISVSILLEVMEEVQVNLPIVAIRQMVLLERLLMLALLKYEETTHETLGMILTRWKQSLPGIQLDYKNHHISQSLHRLQESGFLRLRKSTHNRVVRVVLQLPQIIVRQALESDELLATLL